ncbi:MAG: ATP-binding protein [Rubrivivax sp.]
MNAIVAAAVDAIRPVADEKGVTLKLDTTAAPRDAVFGDPDRLQQVIWNLLSNAVKFTPAKGCVELASRNEGGQLVVSVTDDGCGIHPSFLPHVFERFRQADSSSTPLALRPGHRSGDRAAHRATARRDRHGTFGWRRKRLDVHHHAAAACPPLQATSVLADQTTGTQTAAKTAASLNGTTILLVEDVADSREMLSQVLRTAARESRRSPPRPPRSTPLIPHRRTCSSVISGCPISMGTR